MDFEDWSVVVMGCLLILLSVGLRWWERVRVRQGGQLGRGARFYWAWLPLLLGVGMLLSRLPHLLGAPHDIVMTCDSLNLVLSVAVIVLALRAGGRNRTATGSARP